MRLKAFNNYTLSVIAIIAVVIIVLLPFHAFLTVWAGSNFGHYTLFRLWKEFLLLICALGVIWLFITDKAIRDAVVKNRLIWLILAYTLLDLVVGSVSYSSHDVSGKALAYGLLDDLRFLAFFIVCYIIALKVVKWPKSWQRLIVWPAAIVILFGLLQLSVLPNNVLTHFGYGKSTIPPFETINNNSNYVRIFSTLRGANPLGAYLILPISALVVMLVKRARSWGWAKALLLLGAFAVLVGSYSRGAWIGSLLAVLVIAALSIKKEFVVKYKRWLIGAGAALVVLAGLAATAFSTNARFQNIIFHTQTHSASPVSSDQAHLSALSGGLSSVADHPFGLGPGTSGPASVYNHDRPARIPEDYFLEVGEESGWLGIILFIAINVYVAVLLFWRRQSPFALVMFASLIGITFVNLLLLAWTDDTLSYIWWGLAALAIATPTVNNKGQELRRGKLTTD